ncbi:MAG: hypothetical protein RBT80_06640, partial [Candidatus Vecturithrix sp.]|nr:hypothetical protein [Candidatus Vecturithrix sp.]
MNLSYFNQSNLYQALQRFLAELHVPVNELTAAPATAPDILTAAYNPDNPAHQLVQEVYIAGGVDEAVFQRQAAPLAPEGLKQQRYEGLLIFGVTLKDRANGLLPTRRQLADITRAFNREFQYTPVVVVFRYAQFIAIANAERLSYKQEWREGEKVGKVSLLRDIDVTRPHTGHLKILQELAISRAGKGVVNTFADLYARWQAVFNVALLNKQFYKELSDWYFWALQEVTFPAAGLPNDDEQRKAHTAQNLIRLLTRLLFVWFVKEKHLIPEELFDETYLRDHLLHEFEPRKRKEGDPAARGSRYYRAILQNLFFATLNQTVGKRAFRKDGQQMNVTNLMRYKRYFKDPPAFISLVEACVPFMNGGLFECLDAPDPVRKGKMGGDVIVYEDGFSDRSDNPLCVPDYLFFGVAEHADLSAELGDARRGDVTVNGLITILNSYKFTVTENTPIEEDVALDPELLGRVFENLLASYNPETKTTARKQTGSFYTPREIVNYMVDEALKAYLSQKLETEAGLPPDDAERRLDVLIGYDAAYFQEENRFDDAQTAVLINAIDRCHILDPACGSGAFPMGILHKLVHVLHKLDPDNQLWKQAQKDRAIGEKVAELKRDKALAAQLSDDTVRAQAIRLINDRLRDIETIFDREHQFDDYARKLFLIENCIYGVDIQPIAAQISKLRCFIALIVDQNAAAP